MPVREVVTVFLLDRSSGVDRVLVARRSARVRTYPHRWAGISGSIETADPARDAERELAEETGLPVGAFELVRAGDPLEVRDGDREWLVHPFLAVAHEPGSLRLNWEHTTSRWVTPDELAALDTVPGLAGALARVYP